MRKLFALLPLLLLTGCIAPETAAPPEPEPAYTLEIVPAETAASAGTETSPETTQYTDATAAEEETATSLLTQETAYLTELTGETTVSTEAALNKDGSYTTKEDVALYIYTYGELPKNFITKKEAEKLGWTGGSLEPYAPGCCIGGSRFGNYEGLLPVRDGRTYTECDIDTLGKKSRGAKRIVFSNDGLIYYTGDHYKTFELLYGEETA